MLEPNAQQSYRHTCLKHLQAPIRCLRYQASSCQMPIDKQLYSSCKIKNRRFFYKGSHRMSLGLRQLLMPGNPGIYNTAQAIINEDEQFVSTRPLEKKITTYWSRKNEQKCECLAKMLQNPTKLKRSPRNRRVVDLSLATQQLYNPRDWLLSGGE